MREINFRVWSNRNKEMINVNECEVFLDFNGKVYATGIDEYGDVEYFEVEDIELLQYTGLNDKNGKKIHEGDIFSHHFTEKLKGIVKYGEHQNVMHGDRFGGNVGFYIEWNDDVTRNDLLYWIKISEVIGNIYENADLLNTNTL